MEPDEFKEYKDFLPSRAKLGRLSLWAATEEERLAASRMLDTMRKAGIEDKKPTPWEDSSWNPVNMPTEEEMKLSPTGLATLALFASTPKETETESADPEAAVAPVEPEPAAAADTPAPTTIPDDGINPHLKQLNWPPKGTQTPQPKEEEPPRDSVRPRYVAGRPSEPSKDQQAVSDWNSDANNSAIY